MAIATEDGIHYSENWEDISPGPGHAPLTPPGEFEYNPDTGEVRRKHDPLILTIHPPDRPY